jgi:hypothetical protein
MAARQAEVVEEVVQARVERASGEVVEVVDTQSDYRRLRDPLTRLSVSDAISQSDYRKLRDPLTEPGRRASKDQIPPAFVAQWLNIGTQPWDDAPTPVGYLYRTDASVEHNRMLALLARKDRYNSSKQIYYALTKDGIKIQVPRHQSQIEFFDNDVIHLKEMGGEYTVKLYSRDDPQYNPYAI